MLWGEVRREGEGEGGEVEGEPGDVVKVSLTQCDLFGERNGGRGEGGECRAWRQSCSHRGFYTSW